MNIDPPVGRKHTYRDISYDISTCHYPARGPVLACARQPWATATSRCAPIAGALGAEIGGVDLAGAAAGRVLRRDPPGVPRARRRLLPRPALAAGAADRLRAPLRRARGPPDRPRERGAPRARARAEAGRRVGELRHRLAHRQLVLREAEPRLPALRRRDPALRRRHALREHGARLRRALRRDAAPARRSRRRPQREPRLRPGERRRAQVPRRGADLLPVVGLDPRRGRAPGRPHAPRDGSQVALREPDVHAPHRAACARAESDALLGFLFEHCAQARLELPLPLDAGRGRALGQPLRVALRARRLPRVRARDAPRHDRGDRPF